MFNLSRSKARASSNSVRKRQSINSSLSALTMIRQGSKGQPEDQRDLSTSSVPTQLLRGNRLRGETGDDLAPDIRRCEKSSCEKRKNHQKTTIVRGGFHRKTPRFWQTDHNYRYLGAYRWNEQNTNS
ncbi:unnamed protein product [Dovyalis caffra]|uniref:Uncharacterized protein n=1 Tax=Dovyalis caffra TaxID=77055 RepID=A0AAV1R5Q4_9ROSI|nr:unnamed protein product [Dovyalis caffra]